MENRELSKLLSKISTMEKRDIVKEKEFTTQEVNSAYKLIDKLDSDLKGIGVDIEKKELIMKLMYSFSRSGNEKTRTINLTDLPGHSFARKTTIDQRPNQLRNLNYLYNSYHYANDKRSKAKAERDIRILEKEVSVLEKQGILFQDSSDFRRLANATLGNNSSVKLPSYIESYKTTSYVSPEDHYDDEGLSNVLSVSTLNKKELAEAKKSKPENSYIEKYKDNFFLVKTREIHFTPKEFEMQVERSITINFDKLPQFKALSKEREIKEVEKTIDR